MFLGFLSYPTPIRQVKRATPIRQVKREKGRQGDTKRYEF